MGERTFNVAISPDDGTFRLSGTKKAREGWRDLIEEALRKGIGAGRTTDGRVEIELREDL